MPLVLKKDNLIFSCKLSVTFHKGDQDPFVVWLYDCSPDPLNSDFNFINPTLNGAAMSMVERFIKVVSEIQKKAAGALCEKST